MKAFIGLIFRQPGNNKDIASILEEKNSQNPAYEWVECNGQELSADAHPIAASYLGVVNIGGELKIQVPNLRGKVTGGIGGYTDVNGNDFLLEPLTVGTYKHKLTEAELPVHTHPDAAVGSSGIARVGGDFFISGDGETGEAGGDIPHNNIQPTYGVYNLMLLDKTV